MDPTDAHQPERRPIAARSLGASQWAAHVLVRAGASANAISIVGMLLCIGAGTALAATSVAPDWSRWLWILAAIGVQGRLICNMLDGMVAIESGKASRVGGLYNELPDRVSDIATFAGLGYAAGSSPMLGMVAAMLAVLTAYVRAAVKVAGAPQDYCGPMAKQHRMFVVTLACAYLATAPHSWQGPWTSLGLTIPMLALWIIAIGCVITCLRRTLRGARNLASPQTTA